MEREIIFRGKRLDNGEWVEGHLLSFKAVQINPNRSFILPFASSVRVELGFYTFGGFVEVDPATVGQYTGIKDRAGRKIFEGDIVKTQPFSDRPYSKKARYKEHIGVVEYKIYHFKNSSYEQDYEARWRVSVPDFGGFACYDWSDFYRCEVIGNIWDNPELVEELK